MRCALLLPLVTAGCLLPLVPSDAPDTADTDGTASGCSGGFVEPTSANARILSLTVAAVAIPASFLPDATRAGEPALCVSPDGTAARIVISGTNGPVGLLTVTTPGTLDTFDIASEATIDLILDGLDPTVLVNSSGWDAGELDVTSVGSQLTFELTTAAGSDVNGTRVSLSASLSAAVPTP